ncbi:tail fiber protein [Synechococcus phage S-CAM22]|uniref:Tail fiber protein n=1 Tax=Synechococcus phage S-CAM22 TaxID=1883365 RepID=A0A1D8KQX1_9CAUD|nr:tail tube [Synechococcus phage S-CAM22]YP_010088766.1 tail tube [Synechococcus phage S-CAM22]AOV60937.1 tail fiber protein [Synechococcus phage S-CAM22]AOV61151.1 tail fiber protein [Synechococcus phage S-CAM22]AOV61365.1 tail fiber protein [Synechococcus phage S-CAM22]
MANRGTLDDFKANVVSDFARPNLFQVDLAFPSGIINNSSLINLGNFTVRAANLPSSQIGVIEVPFRGRVLKIAGDRTFEPWTITIQNDSGFVLRDAFELWASSIQAYNENFTSAAGLGDEDDSTGYFADMEVHQLARDVKDGQKPKVIKSYKFYNVFPSNIAAIDLDFGNNDAIEEFTVELQVQYWTPKTPSSNN